MNLRQDQDGPDRLVVYIRNLLESGELRSGDRLPAERDLAARMGISRPAVRSGLKALAEVGLVNTRRGAGTYIADGPPVLASKPFQLLATLKGIDRREMFEARMVLEVGVAGLAAENATGHQLAAIADELAGMFAALDDPQTYLVHDIRFHRAIATASGNSMLAALVETVSSMFYQQRKQTAERAFEKDLRASAESHRHIYGAIRDRDPLTARARMQEHLQEALQAQEDEDTRKQADEQSTAGSREY